MNHFLKGVDLVAGLLMLSLSSCGGSEGGVSSLSSITPSSSSSTSAGPSTSDLKDETYVKWHGRTYYDASVGGTYFNFSASGFEVSFRGSSLNGDFVATNATNDINRPYLAVQVDGESDPRYALVIRLTANEQTVSLAAGLPYGVHTLRVYKRSECANSHVAVKSVSTDGEILPVQAQAYALKIEFFGDSITCGYGVEGTTFEEAFSTRLENALKSYGNYCGNELNADISLISAGGFPLYKSTYSSAYTVDNIPDMFSMADFDLSTTYTNYHAWDNSRFIPDVVVINLGTNDNSVISQYVSGSEEYQAFLTAFKAKYVSFLDKIFAAYPSTHVVASSGMISMNAAIDNAIDEVVSSYSGAVSRLKFTSLSVGGVMPGQGHPNDAMHRYAGHELATAIKTVLGH
jgi:lysophospholipase L1-like esterase